ncbi:MAG: LamB/YcsF family protein [Alphaproteobacteria bacterium]|nr:LamB/YcsF family protein [Alphaproteobacteria bacterium]
MKLDLNADVGEGMKTDAALLGVVTSANIACGAHAGDEASMQATVALALRKGVGIGAHPGYADRRNFGRLFLNLPLAEVTSLVADQVSALMAVAIQAGTRLAHVKPHGALSNQAMVDSDLALAVARGILLVDQGLVFLVPSGTAMARAGRSLGMRVVEEIFADRAYDDRGLLVPRDQPGAVLHGAEVIADRILKWLESGRMTTHSGGSIMLSAQSVCVHGDTEDAVVIAALLRQRLEQAGVVISSF